MTPPRDLARRWAWLALLALASACASVPPIDRYLLHREAAPVEVQGAHGPLTRAQAQAVLADLRNRSPDTAVLERHIAVEQALAGSPLSIGNRVTLLEDGPATYRAMLAAIRAAKSSVHMEMYIFEGGVVGREFAEALIARRRAGVAVRLVYDAVGSIDTPKEFFEGLRAAGIDVVAFHPIAPAELLKGDGSLDHRDHRKLVVVDGRIAFLGGINISRVYGSAQRGPSGGSPSGGGKAGGVSAGSGGGDDVPFKDRPWRDTQVRIEGPVVGELQRLFLAQWARVRREAPLEDKALYPPLRSAGHEVVRAIASSPDTGVNPLYIGLISAIDSAETEVRIMMAYFVPHRELLAAMRDAARRGVDVKLILPSRTDNWLVLQAGRSYYDELLEAGVKIFEREDRLLHAKTATVDGVWSTVGSTNLDWRSLAHNDELNAVVLSPEFAARMNAVFDQDLANSTAITLARWRERPLTDRMREAAARLWARWL